MFGFLLVMPLVINHRDGQYTEAPRLLQRRRHSRAFKDALLGHPAAAAVPHDYISGTEVLAQPNLLISVNICYLMTVALSWSGAALFVHKGDIRRVAVSVLSGFRSNNIYLGFPVVQLAMGEAGLHLASIYVAVCTIFFQVISIGAGEIALNGRITLKSFVSMGKLLVRNPLVVSCVLGVGAALAHVPIHFVLDETMKLVSGAATAVALLAARRHARHPAHGPRVRDNPPHLVRHNNQARRQPAYHVGRAAAFPGRRGPSQGHSHAQLDALRRQLLHNREGMGMDGEYARTSSPRRRCSEYSPSPRGLRARHSVTPRAANP